MSTARGYLHAVARELHRTWFLWSPMPLLTWHMWRSQRLRRLADKHRLRGRQLAHTTYCQSQAYPSLFASK